MEQNKLDQIQQQVEYYLSDKNLSRDQFFHNLLSTKGSVEIEALLKCNKIKELKATKQEIKEALKKSSEVEFADDKFETVKRKCAKPLPELVAPQKKVKKEGQQGGQQHKPEEKKLQLEPLFLTIKCDQLNQGWKCIEEALEKQLQLKPYYIRFNRSDFTGHCAFNANEVSKESIESLIKEGILIEEKKVIFAKMNETEEKEFWDQHGYHYNICMSKKGLEKKKISDKKRQPQEEKSKKVQFKGEVIFANKKFQDLGKLSQYFKELMNKTANEELIDETASANLLELVKYHDNKQKSENIKSFTVGVHPEYKNSRCFFAIKNDGTKEDFSLTKCLNNFQTKLFESEKKE